MDTEMRNSLLQLIASLVSVLGLGETVVVFVAGLSFAVLAVSRCRNLKHWAIDRVPWLPAVVAIGLMAWEAEKTWYFLALLEQGDALSADQRSCFVREFVVKMIRLMAFGGAAVVAIGLMSKWSQRSTMRAHD
jgi:hypothetical protein